MLGYLHNVAAQNKDLMNVTSDTHSASFPCFPLRSCPSSRSFTTWRTEILITSTWRSLFCSFSQRMIPSIAPSTRWWVDTICEALLTFPHLALASRHSEVVWAPLTFRYWRTSHGTLRGHWRRSPSAVCSSWWSSAPSSSTWLGPG